MHTRTQAFTGRHYREVEVHVVGGVHAACVPTLPASSRPPVANVALRLSSPPVGHGRQRPALVIGVDLVEVCVFAASPPRVPADSPSYMLGPGSDWYLPAPSRLWPLMPAYG